MSAARIIVQELATAAAITGTDLHEVALRAMAEDLAQYPLEAVVSAIRKARREVKGRLVLADVIDRIEHADGHPGPEEAWALVPVSEDDSTVWTDEIAQAAGIAHPLIARGDLVAARLAFKDAYSRLLEKAREERRTPVWRPSLGRDRRLREAALTKAIELQRLTRDRAQAYLPEPDAAPTMLALVSGSAGMALEGPSTPRDPDELRRRIAALRAALLGDSSHGKKTLNGEPGRALHPNA